MSDRSEVQSDALRTTETLELLRGEICPIISDDAVRDSESEDDALHKVGYHYTIAHRDRFSLDLLGELIHCNQEVSEAPLSCFQRAHHVKAPLSEGPSKRNGLQLRSWHVGALGIPLIAVAGVNSELEETGLVCFSN